MEENSNYAKSTQGYYRMLKLQIVIEIERGSLSVSHVRKQYGIHARSTVVQWLRKFGNFDRENQTSSNMPKTPEKKIMEIQAKIKVAGTQAYVADKKATIFDMIIDIA